MRSTISLVAKTNFLSEETIKDLKEYNSQSLLTQSRGGEDTVDLIPVIVDAFNLFRD